jgi:predicted  nucleic acid-binding Zn-ribbon protein
VTKQLQPLSLRSAARRTALGIAFAAIVCLATMSAGRAATTQAPPAATSSDALLTEVRALRSDLNQAAGASIRTQLLVARLQLQEQRINTVARQLSDVQAQLSSTGISTMTTRMRQLETMLRNGALPQDERASAEQEMTELKVAMEDTQRRADGLAAQEAQLTNAFSAEQTRWLELSQRLDQIERDIARRP